MPTTGFFLMPTTEMLPNQISLYFFQAQNNFVVKQTFSKKKILHANFFVCVCTCSPVQIFCQKIAYHTISIHDGNNRFFFLMTTTEILPSIFENNQIFWYFF